MPLLPVIETVLPVFLIAALGYFYGRRFDTDIENMNRLNMDVFIPALIFSALSAKGFDIASYQALMLAGIAVVLGSGLLVLPFLPLIRVQWKTFVPPMMFTNSGNMGIPILLLAFGSDVLPAAIILFLAENTLHFTLGMYLLNHRAGFLRVLRTPMILASIAGIVVSLTGITLPRAISAPVDMIGQIAIPLMLFTLGIRMVQADFSDARLGIIAGILAPASGLTMAWLISPFLNLDPTQQACLYVFACLPPAVLNYMVAEKYNQEPKKVASIVFIANLMAVITLPIVLARVL
ncbi:MAG: AEC family transporter [Gammaproteobacteria bacterium]|nr:AEC family transporter [Gammaproteobacteria bacterium]